MITTKALCFAVLTLLGLRNDVARVVQHSPELVTKVIAVAERHAVPPTLLLAIGIFESQLGAAQPNAGEWGVHFSTVRQQCRHDASVCTLSRVDAQIEVGARILVTGHNRCGTWTGAARYLRTGQCGVERDETNYGVRAWAFSRRLNALALKAP